MSHENSTTSQNEMGLYQNFDSNGVPLIPRLDASGKQLIHGEKLEYKTEDEAVYFAQTRSNSFNIEPYEQMEQPVFESDLVVEQREDKRREDNIISMNSANPESVKLNTEAETNLINKTEVTDVMNSGVADVVAEQQNINGSLRPVKVGDWDATNDRLVVEEDLYLNEVDEVPPWQVTTKLQALDFIPLDVRDVAHPRGAADEDGVSYGRFYETREEVGTKDRATQVAIGNQVLGFSDDRFKEKQVFLNTKFHALTKEQQMSDYGKNIFDSMKRNHQIQQKKTDKIKALYLLDTALPASKQNRQAVGRYHKDLSEGLMAQQEVIDDLSERLNSVVRFTNLEGDFSMSIGSLEPGTPEYNRVYNELQFAIEEQVKLQKKSAESWTYNRDELIKGVLSRNMPEALESLADTLIEEIPIIGDDVATGIRHGLAEAAVNNTWELVTDVFYGVQGLPNNDPWRLEPEQREGVLYNITSVMTEYMTPFLGTRAAMTKVGEVVKDISALAVAGLWMKPDNGNIIHLINQLNDEELDWLSTLDITPSKDDPAYKKLAQRLSSSGQEALLGSLFHSVVWANRLGMREVWSTIKTQKKYATIFDNAFQKATGVNLYSRRVDRLKTSAQFYNSQGMDRQTIFQKTGYHIEPDGNWHFRGDYSKGKWSNLVEGDRSLSQILDDKTLYGRVSETENTRVSLRKARKPGTVEAEYRPETNTIVVYADDFNTTQVKSKIWHEIQHNIDDIQGFEGGAESADFYSHLNGVYDKFRNDIRNIEEGTTAAEKKVVEKFKNSESLTKKEQDTFDKISSKADLLRAERDSLVGIKGRPRNVDEWGSSRDNSQYSRTALNLKLRVVGERRAEWIEKTWDKKFKDIQVVDYPFSLVNPMDNVIYLRDFGITTSSRQKAEVAHVLENIRADLKKAGLTPDDLPKNELEMFRLLESDNPNAALLVNKVVTNQLVNGYHQAVIRLGDKHYAMTHTVDVHMSPTSRCKGKACEFKDPRDILSVIDLVRKIKPTVVDDNGVKKLVYSVMHEDKVAYQLVIKAETALDAKGNVKRIAKGKKKGQTKQEHVVVTFHPMDGFDTVSARNLLNKVSDNRNVNIIRQESTNAAEAMIAQVSLQPLKVQQRLLSAELGQVKDPVQKNALIARVKDINSEIKANKKTNVKVSILDDIKTLEWNDVIYSKLDNFASSLPDDTVFNSVEEIITAAEKFGVKKAEILASRFFHGTGWKSNLDPDSVMYDKGMILIQVQGRKDAITFRSFTGNSSKGELDWDLNETTDQINVYDRDTGYEAEVMVNYDNGMYRQYDGYANPVGEPLDYDEAFDLWWEENNVFLTAQDLDLSYAEGLIVKRGSDNWVNHSQQGSAESYYQYQVKWDLNSDMPDPSAPDHWTRYYATEEEALIAANKPKYNDMFDEDLGKSGIDNDIEYDVYGTTYSDRDEAIQHAVNIIEDQIDEAGERLSLWREYTVAEKHNMSQNTASNYALDTYNIDNFQPTGNELNKALPNRHWSELNDAVPDVEVGGRTSNEPYHYPEFDNRQIQAWVRRFDWHKGGANNGTLLDELQADWPQQYRAQQVQLKVALDELGMKEYDSRVIQEKVVHFKKQEDFYRNTARAQVNARDNLRIELSQKRTKLFEDNNIEASLKDTNKRGDKDWATVYYKQMEDSLEVGVEKWFNEAAAFGRDPQDMDAFFEHFMRQIDGHTDALAEGKISSSAGWAVDMLDDTLSAGYFGARNDSIGRIAHSTLNGELDSNTAIAKIIRKEFFRKDFDSPLNKLFERQRMDQQSSKSYEEAGKYRAERETWEGLESIIPKPPMSDTSEYVRLALLDQMTKSIKKGDDFFGWWDADVQNKRWHNDLATNVVAIGSKNSRGNFYVKTESKAGVREEGEYTREELVKKVGEKRVHEIESALDASLSKLKTGDAEYVHELFSRTVIPKEAIEFAGQGGSAGMYYLKNSITTGNSMDLQYDKIMVNVMNKLLGGKKLGYKMERVQSEFGNSDDYYWKINLTDEVKDIIMNTKHQLYK